jgi:hypothetical protein
MIRRNVVLHTTGLSVVMKPESSAGRVDHTADRSGLQMIRLFALSAGTQGQCHDS